MALPFNPYMNNPLPGAEPLTPTYPTTGGNLPLPYNQYMNNPLPGADPLTPTYPTTGGDLPQFRTTGGYLPMAGGMTPTATGTPQPMATGSTGSAGSTGYALPNFGSMGSNPYAFSRPDMMTGTGRDRTASAYNTATGTPQTQSFNYGGNQYSATFGAGMTPAEITRLMTDYAGPGMQTFNPTDAMRQYYGYQNDLTRMQAEAAGGQAGAQRRLANFSSNAPNYSMTFTPGTEGAVNPYLRTDTRTASPGGGGGARGRGLLG